MKSRHSKMSSLNLVIYAKFSATLFNNVPKNFKQKTNFSTDLAAEVNFCKDIPSVRHTSACAQVHSLFPHSIIPKGPANLEYPAALLAHAGSLHGGVLGPVLVRMSSPEVLRV